MSLTPAVLIHMTAAIGALVTGPVALWARKGRQQRPRLHRAFGYAWVTLMIVAAVSAIFIPAGSGLPSFAGFSPIHLLIPVTLGGLYLAFRALARGDITTHRKTMQGLYFQACVVAGAFTLLPSRFLGGLLWGSLPSWAFVKQVLAHTPSWVWGLLAALVVLGLTQVRDRTAGVPRTLMMPVAMGALSLWSLTGAFGASVALVSLWLGTAALVVAALLALPKSSAARYDADQRAFHVPGSWVPLALIMAMFLTRYIVNVDVAIHPQLKADTDFVAAITALYGAMSGIFAGRAARLLRLAARPAAVAPINAIAA